MMYVQRCTASTWQTPASRHSYSGSEVGYAGTVPPQRRAGDLSQFQSFNERSLVRMSKTERAAHYVLTLEELAALAQEVGKPAETLMNVVALIARRFKTDVCSAYLLDPDRAHLVLAATLGLRRECVGVLRLALNEGLAGMVAEQVCPVAVEHARNHPRFKYFSEAGEDPYQSFAGVPLIDRGVLQGVLVVQTKEARTFDDHDVHMLVQAAAQVAPI